MFRLHSKNGLLPRLAFLAAAVVIGFSLTGCELMHSEPDRIEYHPTGPEFKMTREEAAVRQAEDESQE